MVSYRLQDVFDRLVDVKQMDSQDASHLALLNRPELGITFTKLHAFKLTDYSSCVFLDADTLVLANVDELFAKPGFAAAPDVGWPDCFNSGVFVFQPSATTFSELVAMAEAEGSFDGADLVTYLLDRSADVCLLACLLAGGDQGLLNQYFSSWATSGPEARLAFGFNMTANARLAVAACLRDCRTSG